MTEPILCLIILAFLGWVLVLKAEIQELKSASEKLKYALDRKLRHMKDEVEVSKGKQLSKSELQRVDESLGKKRG